MDGHYHSNSMTSYSCTSPEYVDKSVRVPNSLYEEPDHRTCTSYGSSSACALPSELGDRRWMNTKDSSTEVGLEPDDNIVAAVNCAQNRKSDNSDHCDKTKPNGDFRLLSESAGQNGLNVRKDGKRRKVFRSAREISNVYSLPWNESDDDFVESKYKIPLAQRIRSTYPDSISSKSCQTLPASPQSVYTSGEVPSLSEVSFGQCNDELPVASTSKQSNVPSVGFPVADDEFGARCLVDSFFDDLSSAKRHQNKLTAGEISSRNMCKKKKLTKSRHKSLKEYPISTLSSSSSATFVTKNAQNVGITNNETQAGTISDVLASIWNDPVDNIGAGNMVRYCTTSKDTETVASCSDGRVRSGAEGKSKRRRFRAKRQISDDNCLNETFDMLDTQYEKVSQAADCQSPSTTVFTDSTFVDVPVHSKSISDSKRRKEKSTTTRMAAYDAEMNSGTFSCENSRMPDMDIDEVSMTGSGLRDSEFGEDYRDKSATTVGNPSTAVRSGAAACDRSASDMTSSDSYRMKKHRLCPPSYLGSGSGNCDINEDSVQHDLARSSTRSVFNYSEDGGISTSCHSGAAIDNSGESSAVTGHRNARITFGNHHIARKSRHRYHTNSSANRHRQKETAADNDNDGDGEELASNRGEDLFMERNTTRHATESALLSSDDIIVIGSDDEETVPTECTFQQDIHMSNRPQRNDVEPCVSADSSSGTVSEINLLRRRQRRTARMSCSAARMSCSGGRRRSSSQSSSVVQTSPPASAQQQLPVQNQLLSLVDLLTFDDDDQPSVHGSASTSQHVLPDQLPDQRHTSANVASESSDDAMMNNRISHFTYYQWRIHKALHDGVDIPRPPPGYHGPSPDSLVDHEVLEYMLRLREEGRPLPTYRPYWSPWHANTATAGNSSGYGVSTEPGSFNYIHPMLTFMIQRDLEQDSQPAAPQDADSEASRTRPMRTARMHVSPRPRTRSSSTQWDTVFDRFFQDVLRSDAADQSSEQPSRRHSRHRRPRWHIRFTDAATGDVAHYERLLNLIEDIGEVSRGMKSSDINKLPTKSFTSSDLGSGEPVPECNICISEYEDGDRLRILQCTHKFHARCIDRWLTMSRSCPTCREEVQV